MGMLFKREVKGLSGMVTLRPDLMNKGGSHAGIWRKSITGRQQVQRPRGRLVLGMLKKSSEVDMAGEE